MIKVFLMKYEYPGQWNDMSPYMYIHAGEYDEALSIGKEICEDRGYEFKSLVFVDDWVNINNMDVIPCRVDVPGLSCTIR